MKQVMVKKGRIILEDVPAPTVEKGNVLVKVAYSCISPGTEMAGIRDSGESIIEKIKSNPERIKEGLSIVRDKGVIGSKKFLDRKLNKEYAIGYSAAGTVIEVGEDVNDIKIGDRVACSGSKYAHHAEYISVSRNLVVKIPESIDFRSASTVSLGAIAMQGVRRADVRLGENIAIIGMGMIGQITSQIVSAAGARVIAIDLDDKRLDIALKNGAKHIVNPLKENVVKKVMELTQRYGADSVIITAATDSKEPLAQAFQMGRKKAKIVLVGVVGMEIERDDMYKKELDFLISTSSGPGRYDPRYEEKGLDYPYHYVRWTENRNMKEYLEMIGESKINLNDIGEKSYSIEDAQKAYSDLENSQDKPFTALLKYDSGDEAGISRVKVTNSNYQAGREKINVAIIGAGELAKAVHLPNLEQMSDIYSIYAIMSRTGHKAKAIAKQYNAKYATTDYKEILNDENVDMVMICTRHDLHSKYSIEAMKQGKAVFVEKPVALDPKEMYEVMNTLEQTNVPYTVGFNRRFSKYMGEVKRSIGKRRNPVIINYRMNAGYVPLDNWVHNEEGGGRIIGEGCHIFDLFNYLTESRVKSVSVESIAPNTRDISHRDNIACVVKYEDGSVCTLVYTALGHRSYPKEFMEIYCDGTVITVDDYKMIRGFGVRVAKHQSKQPEKGHYEELVEFAKAIKSGNGYTIPLWQIKQAMDISFAVEDSVKG